MNPVRSAHTAPLHPEMHPSLPRSISPKAESPIGHGAFKLSRKPIYPQIKAQRTGVAQGSALAERKAGQLLGKSEPGE